MEIKVFKEDDKKVGKRIYLRLVETDEGAVVIACDETGEEEEDGRIVEFNAKSRKVETYHGVNKDFGLALDKKGRIIVKK